MKLQRYARALREKLYPFRVGDAFVIKHQDLLRFVRFRYFKLTEVNKSIIFHGHGPRIRVEYFNPRSKYQEDHPDRHHNQSGELDDMALLWADDLQEMLDEGTVERVSNDRS